MNLGSEISLLTNEIHKIKNYEDELDYYSKTHEILLDYYDDKYKMSNNNQNNIATIKKRDTKSCPFFYSFNIDVALY